MAWICTGAGPQLTCQMQVRVHVQNFSAAGADAAIDYCSDNKSWQGLLPSEVDLCTTISASPNEDKPWYGCKSWHRLTTAIAANPGKG